jgi:hypothetical protein
LVGRSPRGMGAIDNIESNKTMAFMMSLYFYRTKTMNPKDLAIAYAREENITALLKNLSLNRSS